MVSNGNDDVEITNGRMGGDPVPGVKKQFGVVYTMPNGQTVFRSATEGETIDLVPIG